MKRRIVFFFESLASRGPGYRVGFIFLVLACVAALGGSVALLIEGDEFAGRPAAYWWAVLRISDPGYLEDDGASVRLAVLSVALSLAGTAFMVGGVAAVMTQWLTTRMASLAKGTTPVPFSDHVVLIGWNDRLPHVVAHLLKLKSRERIVVLCERSPEAVYAELAEVLTPKQLGRVVPRTGSPRSRDQLERAAPARARRVISPEAGASDDATRLRELAALRAALAHETSQEVDASSPRLDIELSSHRLLRFASTILPHAHFLEGDQIVAEALTRELDESPQHGTRKQTLIVGASNALPELLTQLQEASLKRDVVVLTGADQRSLLERLRQVIEESASGAIASARAMTLVAMTAQGERELAELDLSRFDEVIFMAGRGDSAPDATDDQTLARVVALASISPTTQSKARVVMELLDQESVSVIELARMRQCVTPRLVGEALATAPSRMQAASS